jgi:hypothetical protein
MNRRGFIAGLAGLLVAPAIVRAASLMPVNVVSWDTAPRYLIKFHAWDGTVLGEQLLGKNDGMGTWADPLRVNAPDGTRYTTASFPMIVDTTTRGTPIRLIAP